MLLMLVIVSVSGGLGINSLNNTMNKMYFSNLLAIDQLSYAQYDFAMLRRCYLYAMTSLTNGYEGEVKSIVDDAENYKAKFKEALAKYEKSITDETNDRPRYNEVLQLFGDIEPKYDQISQYLLNGDADNAYALFRSCIDTASDISNVLDKMSEFNTSEAAIAYEHSEEIYNSNILFLIIVAIAAFVIGILLNIYISGLISKPISKVVEIASNVAKGKLNVNIDTRGKDETAVLARSFSEVVNAINALVDDLNEMSHAHNVKGEIDLFLEPSKFEGEYRDVALGVNSLVNGHIKTKKDAIGCISQIINGDFKADIPKLPGKKIFINEAIDSLRETILKIESEIKYVIKNTLDGDIEKRIDSKKYQGDWEKLFNGMNEILDAFNTPIKESMEVMLEMKQGHFNVLMQGDYKGDFNQIKETLNSTISSTAEYINDISHLLEGLADGNLKQSVNREYVGQFVKIKESFNLIFDKLNVVMGDINTASNEVSSGAKVISDSSMKLAEGSTEQASAVEQLNASIDTINEKTKASANNAKSANELSNRSKENAIAGNQEMKNMLLSMEGIKTSSDNIAKIIKTIEDIAFQTNLLALNAAVEAARAGEHGKGFAVVAEEVRSLASRSQEAAKETNDLIQDSISKVTDGSKIAVATASSLDTIVKDVEEVSKLIQDIADSAQDQAESISQISIGINQISDVVQSNSATSEEAASASQELASQSEMLKNMVSVFTLRRE